MCYQYSVCYKQTWVLQLQLVWWDIALAIETGMLTLTNELGT